MSSDPTRLDQLHDIVVPPPVSWWPPAPGWYWVFGCAILVLVVLLLRAVAWWQRNCYRREALAELQPLEARMKQPEQRAGALLDLSELLKRTALSAYPREEVAALTGGPWFAFLDSTGRNTSFAGGSGAVLENAVCNPPSAAGLGDDELLQLTTQVRRWINSHMLLTPEALKRQNIPEESAPTPSSRCAETPC